MTSDRTWQKAEKENTHQMLVHIRSSTWLAKIWHCCTHGDSCLAHCTCIICFMTEGINTQATQMCLQSFVWIDSLAFKYMSRWKQGNQTVHPALLMIYMTLFLLLTTLKHARIGQRHMAWHRYAVCQQTCDPCFDTKRESTAIYLCKLTATQHLDEASRNLAEPEHIQNEQQGRHCQNQDLDFSS